MNLKHIFLFLLLLPGLTFAGSNTLVVASWNVENLFDTIDDPDNPNDDSYTPDGWTHWTTFRYTRKLSNLAKIIAAMQPDILCLTEVENRQALKDLVQALHKEQQVDLPFIIHRDGEDTRGIDVAMLSKYAPVYTNWFCAFPGQRDVLVCDFVIHERPVTLLVNHWKSQLGVKEESDAIRRTEAKAVRKFVNARLEKDPNSSILILGDFNDNVTSPILVQDAGLSPDEELVRTNKTQRLFWNLSGLLPEDGRGSYYYSAAKRWNSFDSISVSPSMLTNTASVALWQVKPETYSIFKHPDHTQTNGTPKPFRYIRSKTDGNRMVMGFSDHFPVRVELEAVEHPTEEDVD
jgi:endonuclease/exonuclease/phosphatase family metal-dependent hydrolase